MNGNLELTKQFIDTFHLARKIPGMMPDLPDHLTPRHIHIMEYICQAPESGIRISEIARQMHSTMPSITKLVNELTAKGLARKRKDQHDRRVCAISATPSGRKVYRIYVEEYHRQLADLFSEIPEEDIRTAIRVIRQTYDLISLNPIRINSPNRLEFSAGESAGPEKE